MDLKATKNSNLSQKTCVVIIWWILPRYGGGQKLVELVR